MDCTECGSGILFSLCETGRRWMVDGRSSSPPLSPSHCNLKRAPAKHNTFIACGRNLCSVYMDAAYPRRSLYLIPSAFPHTRTPPHTPISRGSFLVSLYWGSPHPREREKERENIGGREGNYFFPVGLREWKSVQKEGTGPNPPETV